MKRLLVALPLAVALFGCSHARKGGELRLKHEVTVDTPETLRADTGHQITSFGESENGELYAVTSAGGVYQVLAS